MSKSVLTVSECHLPVPDSTSHASFRSFDPSSSHPLCPLQLDACVDWNVDTGATSHMTPHRHWLHNYVPKRVPIKLADNKTVYSAGEGIVYFNPIIDGKAARTFGFTRVLHVPDLRNNLLSVLFLTRQKGFTVTIDSILAILKASRDGSSTTELRRRLSSQRELTLMRGTSLCLSVLHQPLSLLQVQKLRVLLLPLQHQSISQTVTLTTSHQTRMTLTLTLMMSPVLISLWIMGGI